MSLKQDSNVWHALTWFNNFVHTYHYVYLHIMFIIHQEELNMKTSMDQSISDVSYSCGFGMLIVDGINKFLIVMQLFGRFGSKI